MVNFKVLKQKMTAYSSSSMWYVKLVSGLTGFGGGASFSKSDGFRQNLVHPTKNLKFLEIDIIGIGHVLHIKFCAWVDLRLGISYKSVAKPVN